LLLKYSRRSFLNLACVLSEVGRKYIKEEKMVLKPEERKIILVEVNGKSINPDEIREINPNNA
jgi:hypothetical protein